MVHTQDPKAKKGMTLCGLGADGKKRDTPRDPTYADCNKCRTASINISVDSVHYEEWGYWNTSTPACATGCFLGSLKPKMTRDSKQVTCPYLFKKWKKQTVSKLTDLIQKRSFLFTRDEFIAIWDTPIEKAK